MAIEENEPDSTFGGGEGCSADADSTRPTSTDSTGASFQTWFVSRSLSPAQTSEVLLACKRMVDGSVPISRSEWDRASKSDDASGLRWREDVYETVKSMKRKWKREEDKSNFQQALDKCRRTSYGD